MEPSVLSTERQTVQPPGKQAGGSSTGYTVSSLMTQHLHSRCLPPKLKTGVFLGLRLRAFSPEQRPGPAAGPGAPECQRVSVQPAQAAGQSLPRTQTTEWLPREGTVARRTEGKASTFRSRPHLFAPVTG